MTEFFVALLIGALVGTERTLDKRHSGGRFLGLRSFVLISQLGGLCGHLAKEFSSPWILLSGLLAVGSLLGVSYWQQHRKSQEFPGLVTELAGLIVYFLSALAILGYLQLAVAMGIITTGLLALKESLHGLANQLRAKELLAALQLLFATFIILPTVPDRYIDPWNAINPQKLWLLVIALCSLSTLGYVATRFYGQARGTIFTGLFGGLVSSTAITLNLARRSATNPEQSVTLGVGIFIAWLVMFARILVVVAVLRPSLFAQAAYGLCLGGLAPLAMTGYLIWRRRREGRRFKFDSAMNLQNPFELWSAIQFAAFFAIVLLLTQWAQRHFAIDGIFAVTALAAITDVDALTLSMTEMVGNETLGASTAARALILAAIVNSASKAAVASFVGTRQVRRGVSMTFVAALGFGAVGWFSA